jgi:hypothetical protein
MAISKRLPLNSPVGLHGSARGIWVADAASQSMRCFDPADAREVGQITLPEVPVSLTAVEDFVAVAFRSGQIAAFDLKTGAQIWNRAAGSAAHLKAGAHHIWAAEIGGDSFLAIDRSGWVRRFSAEGWSAFAPYEDGICWLSRDGMVAAQNYTEDNVRTTSLGTADGAGGMTACSNAVWLSAPQSLLLVEPRSMEVRSRLDAPEGPVPHLVCDDGKLAGGLNGVFVLNPMADARVHSLAIRPSSPLRGLGAAASKIWALESAEPLVHIADFI